MPSLLRSIPGLYSVALLILMVVLSGCFGMEATLQINPDGSGTLTESAQFSPIGAEMMQSMAQSMDEEEDSRFQVFTEEELRSEIDGEEALEITSLTIEGQYGERYERISHFENINDVAFGLDPDEALPDDTEDMGNGEVSTPGASIFDDITFTFEPGTPATLTVQMPPSEPSEAEEAPMMGEEMEGDPQMEQMMQMMSQDMRFRLAIDVNGTIVDTNARHVQENVVTLLDIDIEALVNADAMEEAMEAIQALDRYETGEERLNSEEMQLLDELDVRIETEDTIRITFE